MQGKAEEAEQAAAAARAELPFPVRMEHMVVVGMDKLPLPVLHTPREPKARKWYEVFGGCDCETA